MREGIDADTILVTGILVTPTAMQKKHGRARDTHEPSDALWELLAQ